MRHPYTKLVAISLLLLIAIPPYPPTHPDTTTRHSIVVSSTDYSSLAPYATQQLNLIAWYRAVSVEPAVTVAVAPTSARVIPVPSTKRPVSAPPYEGDVWWALALCESGGKNANTGNGFYGYFQFTSSTFHSLGYDGLPVDYDYETQREAAMTLQARSGWGQWPACSRRLGLS